jgi:hypothetical protein
LATGMTAETAPKPIDVSNAAIAGQIIG